MYQFHEGITMHLMVSKIRHNGCQRQLVSLSHKAWHLRLHHHRFGGNHLCAQLSAIGLLCMRQCHQLPRGDALRQGKLHSHMTCFISEQGRIEKSRFVQIAAHRNIGCHSICVIILCHGILHCLFHALIHHLILWHGNRGQRHGLHHWASHLAGRAQLLHLKSREVGLSL